jgi:signal transduction histidine kinase
MPRTADPGRSLPDLLVRILAVGFAYYLAARFGIHLSVRHEQLTPVWIPSALALAAVIYWGPWMVVGVASGEFIASVLGGISGEAAAGLGIGNALEPLVALAVLRALDFDRLLVRSRDVVTLVAAAAAGAAASATVGVASLVVFKLVPTGDFGHQWLLFWSSVTLGIVLIAPMLLAWFELRLQGLTVRRMTEGLLVLALIGVFAWNTFHLANSAGVLLLFPLFVWATLGFGIRGASTSVLLVTAIAIWIEVTDPISFPSLGVDDTRAVELLQTMLACVAIANLLLAALLHERDSARRRAELTAATLADAQAVAHIGSWELELTDGSPMRWSSELQRLFGLASSDPRTTDMLLVRLPKEQREELRRAIDAAIDRGTPFAVTHQIDVPDGGERTISHVGRVVDAGRDTPRRLVATALDVTERTSIERLRDALIATASHELRTPLTSIVGFAHTLTERWHEFSEQQRLEFIGIIGSQGVRLASVVEDTLMQPRIDAGTVLVENEPYPVARTISHALLGLDVTDVDVRCDAALVAHGSAEHLEQVVVNLVTNASKYGRGPIIVEAGPHGSDPSLLELRVIDHGEGVPREFQERMFERFTRGPSTDLVQGTGLGLSIVRGLANAGGGAVTYHHADGRTTFAVTMLAWSSETSCDRSNVTSAG